MKRSVHSTPAPEDGIPAMATSGVYARLRADILRGHYAPGEPLRTEALKDRYGVGFSPLREALSRLVAEGFVIARLNRGFRVRDISLDDLRDLMATRKVLEGEVAARAVRNGGVEWEAAVLASFHELSSIEKRLIATNQIADDAWEVKNNAFHDAINRACPLTWLKRARDMMYEQSLRYRFIAWRRDQAPTDIHEQHVAIFEAAMRHDEAAIVAGMHRHVDYIEAALTERLRAGPS